MDEGETSWALGDNLRGESVALVSHLVGVPWVQPFHWLVFERWTLSGTGLFSSWVFVVMSGSVRREHDLAGQSLQKVQLHIWPRASEGMRSTHTFCYTACHTPSHMLPSCHTDPLSLIFRPLTLPSWLPPCGFIKNQKRSLLILLLFYLVFSCNDLQCRNRPYRPGSRIVKSKVGQIYFATELLLVLYSDLHPYASLQYVSWQVFWSLFLLYCNLLVDLGLDMYICCRVGTRASLFPLF